MGHAHDYRDDPALKTEWGLWALKVSFLGLLATAVFQGVVVALSGSAALLADTLHNFADAFTSLPLWLAFALSRRRPTSRFTYGYRRAEDLAGLIIVLFILVSAVTAGYVSYQRLIEPSFPSHLGLALAAGVVGFLGNETVAQLKIHVGRRIGSAALVADGQHARVDGLTSLAAVVALLGVRLGFPLADPLAGLVITVVILFILGETGKEVLGRLMDAVDPSIIARIKQVAVSIPSVQQVYHVRARWLGHQLRVELTISLDGRLTLVEAHRIAEEVRHELLHQIPYLQDALVHVDPSEEEEPSHALTAHHFEGHHQDQEKPMGSEKR